MDGWRFPTGLAGGFDVRDTSTAGELLRRVAAWRPEAGAALAAGSGPPMSDGLRDVLLQALGSRPPRTLAGYPYRLGCYPGSGGQPVAALRQVLLWRAGVVDFLADVWDTLGPSQFAMQECAEATRIFQPADRTEADCLLCLGRLPAESSTTHFFRCSVQVAWCLTGSPGTWRG